MEEAVKKRNSLENVLH